MRKVTIIASSVFMALSSGAMANDWYDGVYVGAKMGASFIGDTCLTDLTDFEKCDDDDYDFGAGVFGGYDFTDNWALELGATDYGDFSSSIQSPPLMIQNNLHSDVEIHGYSATVRYNHDLTENLDIYGRLGASYMDYDINSNMISKSSDNNWTAVGAIGLAYNVTHNVKLQAEYEYLDDVLDDSGHFVSLGFSFTFGDAPMPPVIPVIVDEPDEPEEPEVVLTDVDLYYDTDHYELTELHKAELDNLSIYLLDNPDVLVDISGYTDGVGHADYNLMLSKKRAVSVARYLSYKGIHPARLIAKYYGEQNAENDVPDQSQRVVTIDIRNK